MLFNREFQFTGKHAEYVRALTTNVFAESEPKGRGLFQRNVDVLMIAPIIGILFNKKSVKDNSEGNPAKINFEQLAFRNDELKYLVTIVLLNAKNELSTDEKVELAFKHVYNDSYQEKIAEQFSEYLLGGVDFMYDSLIKGTRSFDDVINNFQKFIETFNQLYPTDGIIVNSIFDQELDKQ